jgi:hypothetical protein
MTLAVEGDLVPGGGDLGCKLRPACHLFADEEEGRVDAGFGEHVEDGRGSLWMRAVVEAEEDTAVVAAGKPACDAERRSERRAERGKRRQ